MNPAARPYAEVIGDPIVHSKSPLIHGFWLEKLGIAAEYRACHVRADELAGYFARRREDLAWRGCNVTIPHKESIAPLIDRVDARASAVGAINTVWRDAAGALCGTNTDVDGVEEAVCGRGDSRNTLVGRNAVVIGAGGAARAAFAFLAGSCCASVRVLARSPEKARRAVAECGLAAELLPFQAGSGAFAGADLLINATQLGMKGQDAMPGFVLEELAAMAAGGLVFDMVYAPLETELLKAAARAGLRRSDGLTMLVGQAATAFGKFFGRSPLREQDAKLRRILTS